jgi:hypothetical protein
VSNALNLKSGPRAKGFKQTQARAKESTQPRRTWVKPLVLEGSSHYTSCDWSVLADTGDMSGDVKIEVIYFGILGGMSEMEFLRKYLAGLSDLRRVTSGPQ